MHLVVTLGWESSQSVTKAALKHLLLCHYKWMVMENQLCPTFCACWVHFSSAHGWFIFWKAFKQSSYVCSQSHHLRSRVTPLAWSHTPTPAEQPGAYGIASAAQGGRSQTVAPALGMCSRGLCMPQNLDTDSGKEQEIQGCHSLSRHTHTILQRGLKSLQPLPRNGAQGSHNFHPLQLARMLYMSIWKPQEFASDSTGICFPSTDQNQQALPAPPQCRPIPHLLHSGFVVIPRPSFSTASTSACFVLPPPLDKPCLPLPCRCPDVILFLLSSPCCQHCWVLPFSILATQIKGQPVHGDHTEHRPKEQWGPWHTTNTYPGMPWQTREKLCKIIILHQQDSLAAFPGFVTFGWFRVNSESLISKAGWISQENTFKIRSFEPCFHILMAVVLVAAGVST